MNIKFLSCFNSPALNLIAANLFSVLGSAAYVLPLSTWGSIACAVGSAGALEFHHSNDT